MLRGRNEIISCIIFHDCWTKFHYPLQPTAKCNFTTRTFIVPKNTRIFHSLFRTLLLSNSLIIRCSGRVDEPHSSANRQFSLSLYIYLSVLRFAYFNRCVSCFGSRRAPDKQNKTGTSFVYKHQRHLYNRLSDIY